MNTSGKNYAPNLDFNMIKHETCKIISAKQPLSNALLSDICEDHLPQIGLFSDELIDLFRIDFIQCQLAGAICSMLPL